MKDIKTHVWFLKNLPRELTETNQAIYYKKENPTFSLQKVEDIMKIVEEAKIPPPALASQSVSSFGLGWGEEEEEEVLDDEEDEYEKQIKEAQASEEVEVQA